MIIRNISVRAKLILTTLVIVLLLIILALFYLDASQRTSRQAEFIRLRSELSSEVLKLQNSFHTLLLEGESGQLAAFQRQVLVVDEQLLGAMNHKSASGNQELVRKSEQLSSQLQRFGETLRFTGRDDSIRWEQARNDMELLGILLEEWDLVASVIQEKANRDRNRQLGISMALGIFILANYMILLTMNIGRSFRKLSNYTSDMSRGIIPSPLDTSIGGDLASISANLNRHAADLQKKVGLLTSMSEEGPGEIFTPEMEDELGNALVVLSDYLTRKELDEVTRVEQDVPVEQYPFDLVVDLVSVGLVNHLYHRAIF